MSLFQLPFDVALCCCSIVSASVEFGHRTRRNEGKVRLPTYDEGELESLEDPFDVTEHEDIVDGYPIRETEFWAKVSKIAHLFGFD